MNRVAIKMTVLDLCADLESTLCTPRSSTGGTQLSSVFHCLRNLLNDFHYGCTTSLRLAAMKKGSFPTSFPAFIGLILVIPSGCDKIKKQFQCAVPRRLNMLNILKIYFLTIWKFSFEKSLTNSMTQFFMRLIFLVFSFLVLYIL